MQQILRFTACYCVFFMQNMPALAIGSLPVYLQEDFPLEKFDAETRVRMDLWGSHVQLSHSSCLIGILHGPLFYKSFQAGLDCQLASDEKKGLDFNIYPKISFGERNLFENITMGATVGLTGAFRFSEDLSDRAFFKIQYQTSSAPYKPSYDDKSLLKARVFDLWAQAWESYLSVGYIKDFSWATTKFAFSETLPLSMRRVGSLDKTSAFEYRILEASFRKRSSFLIWGAGLNYGAFTLDSIKANLFFPTAYVGIDF